MVTSKRRRTDLFVQNNELNVFLSPIINSPYIFYPHTKFPQLFRIINISDFIETSWHRSRPEKQNDKLLKWEQLIRASYKLSESSLQYMEELCFEIMK
jgi:hypothetical protein